MTDQPEKSMAQFCLDGRLDELQLFVAQRICEFAEKNIYSLTDTAKSRLVGALHQVVNVTTLDDLICVLVDQITDFASEA